MKGIHENFSTGYKDIKPPGLRDIIVKAVLQGLARDNEKGLWDRHMGRAEQLAKPLLKPLLVLNTLD